MQTKKEKNTYYLLASTLTIIYQDRVEDECGEWILGKTHFNANNGYIYVSTKDSEGKKLDKNTIDTTIRHELFHFILDVLYFREQSRDETLVEWLANATHELNKQGLTI